MALEEGYKSPELETPNFNFAIGAILKIQSEKESIQELLGYEISADILALVKRIMDFILAVPFLKDNENLTILIVVEALNSLRIKALPQLYRVLKFSTDHRRTFNTFLNDYSQKLENNEISNYPFISSFAKSVDINSLNHTTRYAISEVDRILLQRDYAYSCKATNRQLVFELDNGLTPKSKLVKMGEEKEQVIISINLITSEVTLEIAFKGETMNAYIKSGSDYGARTLYFIGKLNTWLKEKKSGL
jgi:hypothetical protein